MTVPPVYPSQVREIPLTQGKVALVDVEDYPLISQYRWIYNTRGYATARVPGKRGRGISQHVKMHRLIMGEPRGAEVDHRNRNKLDNRRSNLRVATHADNSRNVGLRSTNTTGYKGVVMRHRAQGVRYMARIIVNAKHIYLGLYDTAEAAGTAYNDAARLYFGEFAALNEIPQ